MQIRHRKSHHGMFYWHVFATMNISTPHSPMLTSNIWLFFIFSHSFLINCPSKFSYQNISQQMDFAPTLNSKTLMVLDSPFFNNASQCSLITVIIISLAYTGQSPHIRFSCSSFSSTDMYRTMDMVSLGRDFYLLIHNMWTWSSKNATRGSVKNWSY